MYRKPHRPIVFCASDRLWRPRGNPEHVRRLALSEGVLLGAVGGFFGVLLARPILIAFGKSMASFGFLSNVGFSAPTAIATVVVAALIGGAAAAFPAVQAARLSIVEALRRQE